MNRKDEDDRSKCKKKIKNKKMKQNRNFAMQKDE